MFKPRPYDPDRKDGRTPAQRAATMRNFRVFQLRGLHAQVCLLTGPRRELAQQLVDQELVAMGAMTMADQAADRIRKLDAKLRRQCRDCGEAMMNCNCIAF